MPRTHLLIQNLIPFMGMVAILAVYFLKYSDIQMFLLIATGFVVGLSIEKIGVFFSEHAKRSRNLISAQTLRMLSQWLLRPSQADAAEHSYLTGVLLFAYLPLAIFLLTSGGSFIGLGIILGWGWWYCTQIWRFRLQMDILEKKYWDALPIQFEQLTFKNALRVYLIFYGLVLIFGLR